jgi:hypothetical protein
MAAPSARQPVMRTGFLLILLLLAACTRTVPARFPASSAASIDAPRGRDADVGLALRSELPLPGEPTSGWPGLEDAAPQGGHHHAH